MAEQFHDSGTPHRKLPNRWRRPLLLFIAMIPGAAHGCSDDPCENGTCVSESGMRLLDRICVQTLIEGPACEVNDDAEEADSGITADTIGYRLGDQGGSITFHLQAIEAATRASGSFHIEILAVAKNPGDTPQLTSVFTWGSCGSSCSADPPALSVQVDDEYSWVTVVPAQATTSSTIPYDAVLTLSGAGIDIADMRSLSVYPGCSIAGPIGSTR